MSEKKPIPFYKLLRTSIENENFAKVLQNIVEKIQTIREYASDSIDLISKIIDENSENERKVILLSLIQLVEEELRVVNETEEIIGNMEIEE